MYTTHIVWVNLHRVDFFPPLGAVYVKNPHMIFLFFIQNIDDVFFLSVYLFLVMFVLISIIWRYFFHFLMRVEKKKLQYNLKWNVICFVLYTKFPCRGKSKWKILCYIYIYNFFLNKGVLKKLYISCDNLVKNIIYSPLQFIQYI